ncbi:MAG: hypothetical protein CM1200mP2_29730 [Planctomycetaceae bacterium]|nr:MAG: hypothetical protein CM1200mP2_29730 [Planctomycetaceae bacterium]
MPRVEHLPQNQFQVGLEFLGREHLVPPQVRCESRIPVPRQSCIRSSGCSPDGTGCNNSPVSTRWVILTSKNPHAPVETPKAQLVLVDRFRVELAAEQVNSKEGPLGGDLGFENFPGPRRSDSCCPGKSRRPTTIFCPRRSGRSPHGQPLSPRVQVILANGKPFFPVHLLDSPYRLSVGTDVEGAAGGEPGRLAKSSSSIRLFPS